MEIGFIGLGHMGFPMARLLQARHQVIAFDTHGAALERIVAQGARPAASPREVADRADTVLAGLPTPAASLEEATGVAAGSRARCYVDLSTADGRTAVHIHELLALRNVVALDGPVSGGVGGAERGTPAVMVSGPRGEFDPCARCSRHSAGRSTSVQSRVPRRR